MIKAVPVKSPVLQLEFRGAPRQPAFIPDWQRQKKRRTRTKAQKVKKIESNRYYTGSRRILVMMR